MQKIILAIESAEYFELFCDYLKSLSLPENTIIRVIHAVEPIDIVFGWPNDQYRESAEEMVSAFAQQLQLVLKQVTVEGHTLYGDAREVVLDEAEAWPADLIVLGSHGKRGINRFPLGHVSSAVVTRAKCSVLILRCQPQLSATVSKNADQDR